MLALTQLQMDALVLLAKLRHLPAATYVLLDPRSENERELMPIEIRQVLEHFRR